MQAVAQDPRHHAEGNVAIHTQMVIDALQKLPEYQMLAPIDQEILWMAALLHDVEKRSTTVIEEDGSITARNHAKKGARTAQTILYRDFDIPFHIREQIVNLVRYHGLPIWVLHKENPQKALLEANLQVNMHHLYLLAKADMQGRICEDQAEMLERVEFFAEYCKEQGAWNGIKEYPSDLARFLYFYKENNSPDYVPYNDTICEVILLAGLPGMGKDTYIQHHYKELPIISLDVIRRAHKLKPEDKSANGWVAQQAKEQAKVYLRAKQDFIWNATNITKQMRAQLIELMVSYGAKVRIIYIEKPYKTWQQQNQAREYGVPLAILDKMLDKLEVPSPTEAHIVDYIL